jgi:hypothetical protein
MDFVFLFYLYVFFSVANLQCRVSVTINFHFLSGS